MQAVDFLFQKSGKSFCVIPCTPDAVVWTHRHLVPRLPVYDGKPLAYDCARILDAVEAIRAEGFNCEFLPEAHQ